MNRNWRIIVACISLLSILLAGPVSAAAPYSITDLGNLGLPLAIGLGINNSGQIVGWSSSPVGADAFLWQDGTMTDLGTLPGGIASTAYAVNADGLVVGLNYDAHYEVTEEIPAVLWQDGVIQ